MSKFRKTYIEITNKCNLSCDFCPGTSRPNQIMDRKTFRTILTNIKGHSKLIHFHVLGEPLLHPEIGLFLDDCEEFGFQVHVVTNGLLLDKQFGNLFRKSSLRSISISLQSMCTDNNLFSFEKYLKMIHDFVEQFDYSGAPLITLRLWNFGSQSVSISAKDVIRKIECEFLLDFDIYGKLNGERGVALTKNLCINTAERFEWPKISGQDIGDLGYCLGLKDQVAVLVDGSVVPCCLDAQGEIILGNIKYDSLETILNSERARKIRDGFKCGVVVEELCRKCSYRLRFSGKKF